MKLSLAEATKGKTILRQGYGWQSGVWSRFIGINSVVSADLN